MKNAFNLAALAFTLSPCLTSAAVVVVDTIPNDVDLRAFNGVSLPIDLDSNGTHDFRLRVGTENPWDAIIRPISGSGNRVLGFGFTVVGGTTHPLPVGSLIGLIPDIPDDPLNFATWHASEAGTDFMVCAQGELDCKTPGYFGFGEIGFLGVEFIADDGYHYAWIEVQPTAAIRIHRWAYQSTPNTPILAGQIPEPAPILLLTTALTLLLTRRRTTTPPNPHP